MEENQTEKKTKTKKFGARTKPDAASLAERSFQFLDSNYGSGSSDAKKQITKKARNQRCRLQKTELSYLSKLVAAGSVSRNSRNLFTLLLKTLTTQVGWIMLNAEICPSFQRGRTRLHEILWWKRKRAGEKKHEGRRLAWRPVSE